MKKLALTAIVIAAGMLQGCATSEKIQSVKMGDDKLTCEQLQEEFGKLDQAQADIESKKGVTGTNVASALLWLPGLAYTYYDAGEASKLIYERRSHLTIVANKKQCPAMVADAAKEADQTAAQTKEVPVAQETAPTPAKKTVTKKAPAKKQVAEKQ